MVVECRAPLRIFWEYSCVTSHSSRVRAWSGRGLWRWEVDCCQRVDSVQLLFVWYRMMMTRTLLGAFRLAVFFFRRRRRASLNNISVEGFCLLMCSTL